MSFFSFLSKLIPWKRSLTGDKLAGAGIPGTQASLTKPPAAPPMATPLNEDFLRSATWLHLASSNVEALRFVWDTQTLEVQYKGTDPNGAGYYYQYFDITPAEADDFVRQSSPGRWVWDHLRVRGPGNADKWQKPYVRLTGFAGTSRAPTKVGLMPESMFAGKSLASGLVPPWQKKAPWQK